MDTIRQKRRLHELHGRTHLLWSRLTLCLVDDRTLDEGLEVADHLLDALDALLLACAHSAHRGDTDALERGERVIKLKRHAHGLVDRYVQEITGGIPLVFRVRLARTDLDDSRAVLEHARHRHREALAS